MEYRISINHEERFMEVRTQGIASIKGFRSFVSELLEPAYMDLHYNLLIDLSDLDTSALGSSDIRNIIAFLEIHKEKLLPTKHVIVAPSTLAFGFARMYQILSEGVLPMKIQVFSSRDQALQWLQKDAGPSF